MSYAFILDVEAVSAFELVCYWNVESYAIAMLRHENAEILK